MGLAHVGPYEAGAVSYTHLDVYKRQVPMLFKQIDGEKVSNATESPYELMVRDSVAPPVNGE